MYTEDMPQITITLPEKVAEQAQQAIDSGWFNSLDDLVRAALSEYLEEHRLTVIEEQQLADIDWVKSLSQDKRAG
jgi:Arc/MetJ-type ribon-helix-helix transcriptional regulator